MSACKDCFATISFVRLDSGKPIPVNPIPDPTGTVAVQRRGRTLVGYVISREKPLRAGYKLHRAHRADCHTEAERPRVKRSEAPAPLF